MRWRVKAGCDITGFMSVDRPLNDAELAAALDWYRAVGVDLAVGEEPVDRFAASAAAPRRAAAQVSAPAAAPIQMPALKPVAAAPAAAAIVAALPADPSETRALAAAAPTLEALRAAMDAYEGCTLKKRATQLCFADGNPEAEIMLVGEGPGEQEDLVGKPFVGRAGQLLDRMLSAIGLDRSKVYIANMVPWRPPGNRDPSPEEMALCAPFLIRQVELVAPKFLVTLGNVPTKALFQSTAGITRMRGQWQDLEVGSHRVRALATLHPAYLLRTPASKALAWRDMLSLRAALDQ
jgi:uracil-DNA glycosylase family 4